jgi:regulator of protease activity HflC (stomatin/prohibitin superfamily)
MSTLLACPLCDHLLQTQRGITSTKTVSGKRLHLRDRTFDLVPQEVTFLDGERATIDSIFRWRIASPLLAIRVSDLLLALETTMQVAVATVASRIRLADALSSRDVFTRALQAEVRF